MRQPTGNRNFSQKIKALPIAAIIVMMTVFGSSALPNAARAQAGVTVTITQPTEGQQLSGPFSLQGTATVPANNQLSLTITATNSNEKLVQQTIRVDGQAGQVGTFNTTINTIVSGDTPALIEVDNTAPNGGAILAKGQVHVILRQSASTPVVSAPGVDALTAVQLALQDYEARVQSITPMPVSTTDSTFADQCLGLPHSGETCVPGQITGQIVKLSLTGQTYTFNVGGTQARFDSANSSPIEQPQTTATNAQAKAAVLVNNASTATGVKLYVPTLFTGAFDGMYFNHVDWVGVVTTIQYSGQNPGSTAPPKNPNTIQIVEQAGSIAPGSGSEVIQIGTGTFPVQVANGSRSVTWSIQNTKLTMTVPQGVTDADLATLANSFGLPGTTSPATPNPLDLTQFNKLTLALPEPIRSVEMARQALLTYLKPKRAGGIVSLQAQQFSDSCLGLARTGETGCTATLVAGYVIGVADYELFRYNVGANAVRLNRGNSTLVDKSGTDYASVDAARAAVSFGLAAPTDPDVTLLGIQVSQAANVPIALLLYRDNKTNGVFALRESASGTLPAAGTPGSIITINGTAMPVVTDVNGNTVSFSLAGTKPVFVTLWGSPEIGIPDMTRLATSVTSGSSVG